MTESQCTHDEAFFAHHTGPQDHRFTTKLASIKKRLRVQGGAYYPLSLISSYVESVPGTNRVRFLSDSYPHPLEFKVVNRNGLDVVLGLVPKPPPKQLITTTTTISANSLPTATTKTKMNDDPLPSTTTISLTKSTTAIIHDDPLPTTTDLANETKKMNRKRKREEDIETEMGEIGKEEGKKMCVVRKSTRVPKLLFQLPNWGDDFIRNLCFQSPILPNVEIITLDQSQKIYHQFHRGIAEGESRDAYGLSTQLTLIVMNPLHKSLFLIVLLAHCFQAYTRWEQYCQFCNVDGGVVLRSKQCPSWSNEECYVRIEGHPNVNCFTVNDNHEEISTIYGWTIKGFEQPNPGQRPSWC